MILLDTNVVVRTMTGEGRIGQAARQILDDDVDRCCSAMMHWELAMLADKGRLTFEIPLDLWLERAATMLRFVEIPVTGTIARDAGSLPGSIHGDPCDRMMIATARMLACPIITTDHKIITYANSGHVKAIDARR